ncbi:DUF1801 domain-containing protein [uncultured Lacinutrix sp.]|uniref:YdeI/OmpD-associated family protein n=1 Tax=uncultured Lacinutrix sp. TaxID=574032 RepID=UPI00261EE3A0|nr:DUF1801 domain-containing protein [uncultured Lacinutrix sp.]
MRKATNIEAYFESDDKFAEALIILREILNSTEVEETLKWSMPTYTVNGKNIIGIGSFKNHFCLWFHQGVFLKDEQKLLVNAQEKTKSMRQMRFESINDINKTAVLAYIKEAIENQKLGKEIKPVRTTKKTISIPKELQETLDSAQEFKLAFNALTPGKQREYCEYITEAKRETTKISRIEKIIPMILKGSGLNDKYKNC